MFLEAILETFTSLVCALPLEEGGRNSVTCENSAKLVISALALTNEIPGFPTVQKFEYKIKLNTINKSIPKHMPFD